ncbi:MAG: O-methyltransferase [Deltaproteobacteria bacterium]|nr:O-methyltransferase [Deltaproteobacteria bacterium]MBW2447031.1 O-methyltransferase [Deltaproteobacteria bacterium]
MSQERWTEVDDYFEAALVGSDDVLEAVLRTSVEAGLPEHQVSPSQGKLLALLARLVGARRILEIGTLGGYSTIWLARALPEDGQVVTLEADASHARVARANFARAGLADRIELLEGPALGTLDRLQEEGAAPFDLVFVDADKPNNPAYLDHALRLTQVGSVLVFDNVVRDGAVVGGDGSDAKVEGIRRMTEQIAAEPRLSATALQTVGRKGWDGFALALVIEPTD